MGLHRHIYLGAYVECRQKKGKRTEHVFGCTLKECKKHPKKIQPDAEGKFCSTCGCPNGKISIQVAAHVHPYDVVEDELFSLAGEGEHDPNIVYLGPNAPRPGAPERELDDHESLHVDFAEVRIAAEMKWFQEAYAPELTKLREAYDDVRVKWGFHQYFM